MKWLMTVTLFAVCLVISACKSGSTDAGNAHEATSESTEASAHLLPTLPQEIRDYLFAQADYVDMIFYDMPISASQSEKHTVQSVVYFPSLDPATQIPECKPTGRLSYMVKGEIACEADFYFTDQCKYFLFLEDGKVKYGNQMTPNAINFFRNIIARGSK